MVSNPQRKGGYMAECNSLRNYAKWTEKDTLLSVFVSLIRTFLLYIWEHSSSRELSSQCSLCFGQEAIPLSEKNRTRKGHFVKSCSVCSTRSTMFHFLWDGDSRKKIHSLSLSFPFFRVFFPVPQFWGEL